MSRPSFEIEAIDSFTADLRKAQKSIYRKDLRGREEFAALIERALVAVQSDPYATRYPNQVSGNTERFPPGYARDNCLLRKLRFALPRAHGATAFGRIIFRVRMEDRVISLLAFYTHQAHSGNFPQAGLANRLSEAD